MKGLQQPARETRTGCGLQTCTRRKHFLSTCKHGLLATRDCTRGEVVSISPALQFRDSGQTLSSQHQHGGGGVEREKGVLLKTKKTKKQTLLQKKLQVSALTEFHSIRSKDLTATHSFRFELCNLRYKCGVLLCPTALSTMTRRAEAASRHQLHVLGKHSSKANTWLAPIKSVNILLLPRPPLVRCPRRCH